MKNTALLLLVSLALPAWAADVADEVKAAAKKLAEKPNYSWTAKVESAQAQTERQGGRFRGGTPDGQTEKDGFSVLTYKGSDSTTVAVVKGAKIALKNGDEWQTSEELADSAEGDAANRTRFLVRRVQQFKLPAQEAQELVGRVKDLKRSKDGDPYTGELTAEGLKQMFTFRGRQGGDANTTDTSGLKGTAKFWVKDGVLTKYEHHVEGKMAGRNNRDSEINRTTTVEIKDVGTTKVEVPAEAKKKLKAA